MEECVFCRILDGKEPSRTIGETELCFAIFSKFPVQKGHALVIPKRHVETVFELSEKENQAVFELLKKVKQQLDLAYHPKAYNVAANCGKEAGQQIMHAHWHVIPRYVAGKGSEEFLKEEISK